MIIIVLILSILNFVGLLTAGVIYFKEKYTIVPIEEWNRIAGVFNAAVTAGQVDENDTFIPAKEIPVDELPGGYGFFKEEIPDEEFEEEEEEEGKNKRKK